MVVPSSAGQELSDADGDAEEVRLCDVDELKLVLLDIIEEAKTLDELDPIPVEELDPAVLAEPKTLEALEDSCGLDEELKILDDTGELITDSVDEALTVLMAARELDGEVESSLELELADAADEDPSEEVLAVPTEGLRLLLDVLE